MTSNATVVENLTQTWEGFVRCLLVGGRAEWARRPVCGQNVLQLRVARGCLKGRGRPTCVEDKPSKQNDVTPGRVHARGKKHLQEGRPVQQDGDRWVRCWLQLPGSHQISKQSYECWRPQTALTTKHIATITRVWLTGHQNSVLRS